MFRDIRGVPNIHQVALRPLDAPYRRIFLPKVSTSQYVIVFFNFNILALVVSEILGGFKFVIGGPYSPVRTLVEIFAPEASTLLCLMAFLISTFQLLYFPRYSGGPKFTLGALRPLDAPQRRNIFTQSEYFTISNCVFNFNILALVVSEILGGSQIYVRGPYAPCTPPSGKLFAPEASTLLCLMAFLISTFQLFYFPRYQGVPNLHQGALRPLDATQRRNFCTQSEYFTISNCVFNFNIITLVVSEILGGPKFTLGGAVPPSTPLAEFFLYPRRVLYYV